MELGSANPQLSARVQAGSRLAAYTVIGVGSLVILGWLLDIASLKSVLPDLGTMKFNTALCFILSGVALMRLRAGPPRLVMVVSVLVALIGLLTLIEYLFDWNLGVDQWLVAEAASAQIANPGRMSPVTALNFFLVGNSLLLLARSRWLILAQSLTLVPALTALLALEGYVFRVQALYQVSTFVSIALHTAVTFIVVCLTILFVYPERGLAAVLLSDRAGGLLARRLLPASIVVPLIFGWLGLKGQEAGFYDTNFGLALFALSNVVVFSNLVFWTARSLNRVDGERSQALEEQRQANEQLEERVQERTAELAQANHGLEREVAERKQAEQAILRRNAELGALSEMGQALSRLADPAGLVESMYTVIGQILDNQNLYIAFYDEPNQTISFPLYVIHGERISRPPRSPGAGLTEYVLQHRTPLFLPHDVSSAVRALGVEPQGQPAHCYVAVPMLAGDRIIGVICLQDYEHEDVYDTGHVEVLRTIAAQAAIALENARLFAETEQLARTDALTGIANRRQLFEVGERELSRARRFNRPLSALMLDIDFYKQVNDTHGHAVGDQVLRVVARCCLEQLRDSDVVARYGGEEFAIMCLETDLAGGRITAERLRARVAQMVFVSDQGPLNVTVSVGVACAQPENEGFAALLVRADSALYAAKQAGRNRVEAA